MPMNSPFDYISAVEKAQKSIADSILSPWKLAIDNPALNLMKAEMDRYNSIHNAFNSIRDSPAFDSLTTTMDKYRQMTESIRVATDTALSAVNSIQAEIDRREHILSAMNPHGYDSMFASQLSAMSKIDEMYKNSFGSQWMNAIQTLNASVIADEVRYMDNIKKSIDSLGFRHDYWKALQNIESVFTSLPSDEIIIGEDSVSIRSNVYPLADIEEAVRKVLEESGIKQQVISLEQFISRFIESLKNIKDISFRKIITGFVYPLILGVMGNFIYASIVELSDKHFKQNKKIAEKQIKKLGATYFSEQDYLSKVRFVSTKTLNVRRKNSQSSEVMGRLHFGQIVMVIHKNKNWTLVEYRDLDDEVVIRGWVNTRYISNFR